MITFKKNGESILNTRIEWGEEYITPQKIDGFMIMFETPIKGLIRSHLILSKLEDETWQFFNALSEASLTFKNEEFEGQDILEKLHKIYIEKLAQFNNNLEFVIEL